MILQTLNSYYERLQEDPDANIALFGYSRQRVSFRVVLEKDGQLHSIEPLGDRDGTRYRPELIIVPGDGARSGSLPKPFFLWDNPLYVFGLPPSGRSAAWAVERFNAFRDLHLRHESAVNESAFSAVCRFLESWTPEKSEVDQSVLGTYYGVFRIRGATENIHELVGIRNWWQRHVESIVSADETAPGQCLISGTIAQIARIHVPKIKGISDKPGAPSEKFLVAVDKGFTAAESLGKIQNLNSPVSVQAAFQYCTALNILLAPDSRQRIQIGDATTVFWSERPTEAENLLPWVFDPPTYAEDEAKKSEVRSLLQRIRDGGYPSELGEPDTPFYVLGLSPNAARISVRFWFVSTVSEFVTKLRQHFADLQLVRSERDPEFPAVWQLLRETVRESKDLPPLLGGALLRSVLTGAPYPSMFFSSLIRRIRADREVRYLRVAAIKAQLNRNSRLKIDPLEKEIAMALDVDQPEPAYHLGRLFAELEKAQEAALPEINSTIKDRYFGAASATPCSVFPRLIRLSQHHLGKLEKGQRIYHERRIQEIAGRLDRFAVHLPMRDQGLFAIGYYHQRQEAFTKKSAKETSLTENQS